MGLHSHSRSPAKEANPLLPPLRMEVLDTMCGLDDGPHCTLLTYRGLCCVHQWPMMLWEAYGHLQTMPTIQQPDTNTANNWLKCWGFREELITCPR